MIVFLLLALTIVYVAEFGLSSILFPGLLFLLWLSNRRMISRAEREALLQLTTFDDTRIVGALVSALRWPDMESHLPVIKSALTRVLPQVSPEEYVLLTPAQRTVLYQNLNFKDASFATAILKAVCTTEDIGALDTVSWLASRQARSKGAQEVVALANICLPILLARKARSGESLLRSAERPVHPHEKLPRTVGPESIADPNPLLRPSVDFTDSGPEAQV